MHYADYKTILSAKNGMNVYRGCTHGCIYCDSRSDCYQINHDFEDVEVKRDAVAILAAQLKRRRSPCMVSTGAMSDPYLPLERELEVTRGCLEQIEKHGFGVAILTKSDLILRDLDLIAAINAKTKCVVQTTLTTHDEELCGIVEPMAPGTRRRFEVLMAMREARVPAAVWLCPTLPFINDTPENLKGILDYCLEAGVVGIMNFGFGLTLRSGDREYFYDRLDDFFPGLRPLYERTFGPGYECLSPNAAKLEEIFQDRCRRHGVLSRPEEVFAYLGAFENKRRTPSLFQVPRPPSSGS
ncbi:MAG: radical SAM protein [Deltaproteobacteria bacterium]|jgi:DNA repair photolyase|nr:radical SAM protein [Deltaproteobacteria bacterium]